MKFLQYIIITILSLGTAFAATWDTNQIEGTENTSDTSYTYYYGQWCSYCAKVDRYLTWVDAENKINIEKKEVYFNDENRALMSADAQKLGLDPATVGVPFLVLQQWETTSHLIGDVPIIEHFTPILWEAPKSHKNTIVLIVLAIIVLGVVGGLVFWNKK